MDSKICRLLASTLLCWPLLTSAGEHANSHEHNANEVALFVGLTHESHENGPSIGLEYERRLNNSLGLGILAERTWGDFDSWVYAAPFTFHKNKWKFIIAPGFEESHGHTEELVRASVGYEFEANELIITPSISVDFVDGESIYVLGVAIGFGF